jgi:hypothetical protein
MDRCIVADLPNLVALSGMLVTSSSMLFLCPSFFTPCQCGRTWILFHFVSYLFVILFLIIVEWGIKPNKILKHLQLNIGLGSFRHGLGGWKVLTKSCPSADRGGGWRGTHALLAKLLALPFRPYYYKKKTFGLQYTARMIQELNSTKACSPAATNVVVRAIASGVRMITTSRLRQYIGQITWKLVWLLPCPLFLMSPRWLRLRVSLQYCRSGCQMEYSKGGRQKVGNPIWAPGYT